jgi:hypothetical protein
MFGGPICMYSGLVFQKHSFCRFKINHETVLRVFR